MDVRAGFYTLILISSMARPIAGADTVQAAEEHSGGWWTRDTLLGDLGGAREKLAAKGFTYDVTYTLDSLWNVHGGIRTGYAYRADLSVSLELDTTAAGWWKNGHFGAVLQGEHGEGLSASYTGDVQAISNIEADDFAQVSELWYEHDFLDQKLRVKFGKMDTNADFAFIDYGGNFSHASSGFSPTIPLLTYPNQDLALFIGYSPWEWLTLKFGAMQARPRGGRSARATFAEFRGPMLMFEPEFHYTIKGHPGTFRPGVWWNGDTVPVVGPEEDGGGGMDPFAQLELFRTVRAEGLGAVLLGAIRDEAGARLREAVLGHLFGVNAARNDTAGLYFTWDQEVYKENRADNEDLQGVGIFAQGGWSSADTATFSHYFGAGVEWTGAIPGRDADAAGLGVFRGVFSPKLGLEGGAETAVELYYRVGVTPWFAVKPMVDFIDNPGGQPGVDAWVVGFRAQVTF